MKRLLLLLFLAVSCSKSNDGETVNTSVVSYHVEGTGTIYKLQYTVNAFDGSSNATSPGEIFDAELPLVITIDDYKPKRMEAFVLLDDISDREFIDRIYIKKDGKIVDETSFFEDSEVSNIGGIYSVHLNYEW
ncbi:hypothetical protein J0X14_14285 [Muricauda sp. CAU 1633]|uniref:hypothetical protein n=1 Tax=Allomuricauda sp. CAU 1633 TaxID=2816036 RepID=UPI001A905EEF|nr:hypothetical protein [Muricauda sp. CAU 1633]MBO0323473.1 hypothetical protein [Muricauda sp. CAU 1633]